VVIVVTVWDAEIVTGIDGCVKFWMKLIWCCLKMDGQSLKIPLNPKNQEIKIIRPLNHQDQL
jgi:hypothetical protein